MKKEAIVIFGPPTSGKTNISKSLAEYLSADLLRGCQILPITAETYKRNRQLIPDAQFLPALVGRLEMLTTPHLLFENLPRTASQAEVIVDWAKTSSVALCALELVLDGGVEEAVYRSANRLECAVCEQTFHPVIRPFEDLSCDRNDCLLLARPGDTEEKIRQGFRRYDELKADFLPVLLNHGVRHISVSTTGKLASATEVVKQKIGTL